MSEQFEQGFNQHFSVLLQESIDGLAIKPDGIYIDGTFGRGGHSRVILEQLGEAGKLIAIDQDPQAVEFAKQEFTDKRFEIVHSSFAQIKGICEERNLVGKINGVLLDLGVSSPQLDEAERGFSFMREGPLDMRMNPEAGLSAREWLMQVEYADLARVLREYGEEKFAGKIARAVVNDARLGLLNTTKDLADLIARVVPKKDKHKHPATRSFQAIRIEINKELEVLRQVLEAALEVLAPEGRLSIISFHSLEDRLVKQFMRREATQEDLYPDLPVFVGGQEARLKLVGKPVFPSDKELDLNVRSRSAVLRIAERV